MQTLPAERTGKQRFTRYNQNETNEYNWIYICLRFYSTPTSTWSVDDYALCIFGIDNQTNSSTACSEDWLEIYILFRDGNDRFIGRYCGATSPGPVESPRFALTQHMQM